MPVHSDGWFFKTFNEYLRERFGCRVQRISLHAGMTCPNRDGSLGREGCIYCDNASFNLTASESISLPAQLELGAVHAKSRYKAEKFLAYFQTFTNTYAPVEQLREIYSRVLNFPGIVGLMIGTRPDCITPQVADLLEDFANKTMVWVEIGVQSCHESSLNLIRRGHTFQAVKQAVKLLKDRDISLAAHLILGLPGETDLQMLETGRRTADLGFTGVKLHHLHGVKGTALEEMRIRGDWVPQTVEQYIERAALVLRAFSPGVIVMRWVGDCPAHLLTAPHWPLSKLEIQSKIIAKLNAGV